jgi:hypothetical protein
VVNADVIECPDGLSLDEDSSDAAARPQVYRALVRLVTCLGRSLYVRMQQSCNRAATELQQSCNRAATELQQLDCLFTCLSPHEDGADAAAGPQV